MKKIILRFTTKKNKIFQLTLILLITLCSLVSGCSSGCTSAEDMSMDEVTIIIPGYDKKYDNSNPKTLQISTNIFISPLTANQKFDIRNAKVDLCGKDSTEDIIVQGAGGAIDSVTFFKVGDYLQIIPKKATILLNNCENPNPNTGVYINDKDKCKNGYKKEDGSRQDVLKDIGRKIQVNNYINYNGSINNLQLHNVIISPSALTKLRPGRKYISPFEYPIKDNSGKIVGYSEFPEINQTTKNAITSYKNLTGKTEEQVMKDYWCGLTVANANPPTQEINAITLNEFCSNFYYYDDIKTGTTTEINTQTKYVKMTYGDGVLKCTDSQTKSPEQKPLGNLSSANLLYSFASNSCAQEMTDGSGNNIGEVIMGKSNHFVGLFAFILSTTNGQLLLNNYFPCNDTKVQNSRCYNGVPEIPLNDKIEMKNEGILRFLHNSPVGSLGYLSVMLQRSCPLKKFKVHIVPVSGSGPEQVIEIDLFDADGTPITEFTLSGASSTGPNSYSITKEGFVSFSIDDNGDGYQNNTGSVNLSTKILRDKTKNFLTSFLGDLTKKLDSILFGTKDKNGENHGGISKMIYNNIIKSEQFRLIINIFMIMFVTFYALTLLMGLNQFQSADILKTAVKIGAIYTLLLPTSWDFFNKYLFELFTDGTKTLLAIMTGGSSTLDGEKIFGPISSIISRVADYTMYIQLISLLLAGPFGWIFFILIASAVLNCMYAAFYATLIYLASINLIGIMVSVMPLFLILLIFKQTAKIFNAWMKVMISSVFSVVIVFLGLLLMGGFVTMLFDDIFSFGVCHACVLKLEPLGLFQFCVLYSVVPEGYEVQNSVEDYNIAQNGDTALDNFFYGLRLSISKVLCFFIFSYCARKGVDLYAKLATELSDIGFGGPGGVAGIASGTLDRLQWWTKQDKSSKKRRGDLKANEAIKKVKQGMGVNESGNQDEAKKTKKRK